MTKDITTYKKLDFEGNIIKIVCSSCNQMTRHSIISCYVKSSSYEEEGHYLGTKSTSYEVIQCMGCENVSFREINAWSEDTDFEGNPIESETLYPSRLEGRREITGVLLLPEIVRAIYQETHKAISNRLSVLSGVGIRAIIEAVCNEKEAKGRNLEDKIDNLVDQGFLARNEAEILHGTRILGNKAAHEQKPLDHKNLSVALDIAEHLLETVYILPEISSHFPKRNK